MDWFTILEAPTQVAIVGVLAGLVTAAAAVSVAIINNRRAGGGKAEIAALTMDASSVRQVAAAIEANTATQIEANMIARAHSDSVARLAKATEELGEGVEKLRDQAVRLEGKLK